METIAETDVYRIVKRPSDGVEFVQMRTDRGFGRRVRLTAQTKGGLSKTLRDLLNTTRLPLEIITTRGWERKATKTGKIRYVKDKAQREQATSQPKPEPEQMEQFTIRLYTEAPKRQSNLGAGIIVDNKIFTEYLPQGQSVSLVGNVRLLRRLPRLEWQTVSNEDGIQLMETLIEILKQMGDEGYFVAMRLENTRSKWSETNTLVRVGDFQRTPNLNSSERIDFRRLLVRDDPECGNLPTVVCKYMGYELTDRITPYKSNFMKHNHQSSLCWLSCIIDPFMDKIDYLKKKRQTGFINLLSYENLAHFLFGDKCTLDELKERGICWDDVLPFFQQYKIKAFLLDVKLQLRDGYIPEKQSQSLRPSALYFMVHNNHVYRLNSNLDEIEKTVLSREVVLIKDEKRSNKHISLPTKDDKKTNFVVISGDKKDWVENAFSHVLQAIKDKEKVEQPTTVFIPQNMIQELPFYIYQHMNVESRISLKDFSMISAVKIYNTTFTSIDNHISGSIEFKGKDVSRLEYFFKVLNQVKCRFMNREWISIYHPSVYNMLSNYKPIAISTGTGIHHLSMTMWDIKKCYTSIVINHLKYLPVFNGMDTFSSYFGEEIENWTIYLVQKLDNSISYPFHRNSMVFGYNLKAINTNVKIVGMMKPSHLVESHLGDVLKKLFSDDKLSPEEFSKNPHKWIANTCIGLMNRDRVSKTKGSLFSSLDEASTFTKERKGVIRIVNNALSSDKLYLHIEDGCYNLKSGFLPIAHFIVDTGNRLIMELKRDLESCGFKVSNILTDCCNTEQDLEKEAAFRAKFEEKWFHDGLGSLRVEHKNRKSPIQKVRDMENVLLVPKIDEVKIQELKVENEWDLTEIHSLFDKHDLVGVEAIMPGSGKTYCAKKYQKKSLFVVPTNKIRANLLKDGLDAITVCSLLGGDLHREDAVTDYSLKRTFKIGNVEKTIDDYECLVFDEMMLNNIDTVYRIKRFLKDYGDRFKVLMNYDPFQNKAVGERLSNVKDVRAYKLRIVREICGKYLVLKEMKRNTNPDNMKHYIALKGMLDRNDKNAMIDYVLKNCNVVGRVEDIKSKINISYRNVVREQISDHVYRMIHGTKPWSVGQVLIYKGKSECIKGIKGRFFKNVEYEILEIGDACLIEDAFGDRFSLPLKSLRSFFVLPYCWTCHSIQGDTIHQPFTIDINDLYLIDVEWLWTSITRTTDWSHISIYFNKMIQKNRENMLKRVITDMIEGHARADLERGRFIADLNEYIDTEYVMGLLNSSCAFCGDPYEVGGCCGSFSVDRIDNSRPHTKDNVRVICRQCNSVKR